MKTKEEEQVMCPSESGKDSISKKSPSSRGMSRQVFAIVDDLSFNFVKDHIGKQPSILTELFGDQIQTRVIQLLLQLEQINFKAIYLLKAAQLLQVSHSSVDRVIRPLLENDFLLETGLGRRRYFRLNTRNPIVKELKAFYSTAVAAMERERSLLED